MLEKELQDSQRARAELEQQLDEERIRAVAEHSQLGRLAARLEQLESSRNVHTALLEDNHFLRAELQAEKSQVQELARLLELMKGEAPPPTVVLSTSQAQLQEENEKLRHDLQQSQIMLARYTEELSMIMPDVELILTQWKSDNNEGGSSVSAPPALVSSAGLELPAAPRPVAASSQQASVHTGAIFFSEGGVAEGDLRDRCVPALVARPLIPTSAAQLQHLEQQQSISAMSRPKQRPKSPAARLAHGAESRPRSAGRGARPSTSPGPPSRSGPAARRGSGERQIGAQSKPR